MWTKKQIKQFQEASDKLYKIKDLVFSYLHEGVSEYEVQQFILQKFKEFGLKNENGKPIVAFGPNTGFVHYYPKKKSRKLKKNTLVLIDIWGKVDGPYADITWMGYYGKVPVKVKKIFDIVIKARDKGLNFIRREVNRGRTPICCEVDRVVREVINSYGYGKEFKHSTGHSLGNYSPHGIYGGLRISNKKRLLRMGYTIEPGIYFENDFGIRSEIDFYISDKVVVSGAIQRKLVHIR